MTIWRHSKMLQEAGQRLFDAYSKRNKGVRPWIPERNCKRSQIFSMFRMISVTVMSSVGLARSISAKTLRGIRIARYAVASN